MGRGNVCMTGPYEGLYYIDNDHIHVYRDSEDMDDYPETRLLGELDYGDITSGTWVYDEEGTMNEQEDIERCFVTDFTRMFPSFKDVTGLPDKWVRAGTYGSFSRRVLAESKLFYVCIEDNEWSMAIELVQKDPPWSYLCYDGPQARFHQRYLEGIKECLLARLPSIGTYTGAWTSGRITREEFENERVRR